MKVRITLTLDIDPERWESVYGTEREQLRDDVRSYIEHSIWGSAAADAEAITRVEVKK
jgi:hypothetical protein